MKNLDYVIEIAQLADWAKGKDENAVMEMKARVFTKYVNMGVPLNQLWDLCEMYEKGE